MLSRAKHLRPLAIESQGYFDHGLVESTGW